MQSSDVAGPGSVQLEQVRPKPLLEGATQFEYVTILNPLPVDFVGLVGQSRPVNVPFELRKDGVTPTVTTTEMDAARNYGLNLKNKDHEAKTHFTNRVLIPSGKSINIVGNEAQVVVRQLVTTVLQRRGKRLLLSNPVLRRQVEEEVVLARGDVNSLLDKAPTTPQQQFKEAVANLNKEQDEVAFPTEIGRSETGIEQPAPINSDTPRKPGRPKKTD